MFQAKREKNYFIQVSLNFSPSKHELAYMAPKTGKAKLKGTEKQNKLIPGF